MSILTSDDDINGIVVSTTMRSILLDFDCSLLHSAGQEMNSRFTYGMKAHAAAD